MKTKTEPTTQPQGKTAPNPEFLASIPQKEHTLQIMTAALPLPIKSQPHYDVIAEFASTHLVKFLGEIDKEFSEIIDTFDQIEKSGKKGKKQAAESRDRLKAPAMQLVSMLSRYMADWQDEQEKLTVEALKQMQAANLVIAEESSDERRAQVQREAIRLIEEGEDEAGHDLLESLETEGPSVLSDSELEQIAANSRPRAKGSRSLVSHVPVIIDESQVKREFCKPDMSLIKAYVKKHGRKAESVIGGIRVERKRDVGFLKQ